MGRPVAAREEILGRIRAAAVGGAAPLPPPAYRRTWQAPREAILARLTERLAAYGVSVLRAGSEAQIAGLAGARFAEQGIASLIVPADLPAHWRPAAPTPIEDTGQDAHALNAIAGVMTGCALAVAETGSIVLDAGPGQGRRALTLVPDYYLCVVRAGQVVGLVPEAVTQLQDAACAGRPITFISGPSATADIELSRVAGVHGPRRLDVILVD